ncbi:ATP-dependent zinc protease family protein [Bacterioplanoides pacificum]|uniref:ATP-dependent zinc protease n=1 Tax=Bacterioplanoides pacificum TaxID=1171596 RepID=A0ABV7VUA6_9GAMM
MPRRAASFVLICSLLSVTGCSIWPSAEHRAVTEGSIRSTLEQVVSEQEAREIQCTDTAVVDSRLQLQGETLERVSQQLQMLTAASPALATADCPPAAAPSRSLDGKTLVGATEWIYLAPPGRHYKARVDSGAATSSLSAINIQKFERNGQPWVRFDLQHDDDSDATHIEVPLERHVRIRQASADEIDRRAVVKLTVNLGSGLQQDTEFSLTDRSEMTYPILLGRSFLRDMTLIDVGRRFVQPKFIPDDAGQPKP